MHHIRRYMMSTSLIISNVKFYHLIKVVSSMFPHSLSLINIFLPLWLINILCEVEVIYISCFSSNFPLLRNTWTQGNKIKTRKQISISSPLQGLGSLESCLSSLPPCWARHPPSVSWSAADRWGTLWRLEDKNPRWAFHSLLGWVPDQMAVVLHLWPNLRVCFWTRRGRWLAQNDHHLRKIRGLLRAPLFPTCPFCLLKIFPRPALGFSCCYALFSPLFRRDGRGVAKMAEHHRIFVCVSCPWNIATPTPNHSAHLENWFED